MVSFPTGRARQPAWCAKGRRRSGESRHCDRDVGRPSIQWWEGNRVLCDYRRTRWRKLLVDQRTAHLHGVGSDKCSVLCLYGGCRERQRYECEFRSFEFGHSRDRTGRPYRCVGGEREQVAHCLVAGTRLRWRKASQRISGDSISEWGRTVR